jgi:uncharacterized protein (TIGR02453 family)
MSDTEFDGFSRETIKFLAGLSENNEKAWFDAHRADYDNHYIAPAKAFVAAFGSTLKSISPDIQAVPKVNGSIFRINRDVRFAKDKRPYKDHLDMWFWEGERKGWDKPGYFFRMTSTEVILGTGMHKLDKQPLKTYREHIADDGRGGEVAQIARDMRAAGYNVGGEHYKRVPSGYPKDHPRADLLRHNGFFVETTVEVPEAAFGPGFVDWCYERAQAMAPVHHWMRGLTS